MTLTVINTQTGEVFEPEVPFRTITNLKGYKDGEKYKKGSSLVDLTGYEPLASIVARCTRTMRAPGGQGYNVLDMNALKAEYSFSEPVYEASGATSIDDAFEKATDVTEVPGFDLVDAGEILAKSKDLSTTAPSGQYIASDPAPAVGKSEDDPKIEEVENLKKDGE